MEEMKVGSRMDDDGLGAGRLRRRKKG